MSLPKRTELCVTRFFDMLVTVAAQPVVIAVNRISANANEEKKNRRRWGGTVDTTIGTFVLMLHCATVHPIVFIKA